MTKLTPKPNYVFNGLVLRVIDGDTIVVRIDHGFEPLESTRTFRLLGYNAPEKRGDEKPWGLISKAFMQRLVDRCKGRVIVQSAKPDKFGGRWNATIWPDGADATLNQLMLEKKFGYAYTGGKKLRQYPVEQLPIQPDDFDYVKLMPKQGWEHLGL